MSEEGDDAVSASVSADDSNYDDNSSRATTPYSMELDLATPTIAALPAKEILALVRETESLPVLDPVTAGTDISGSTRRDTPIPPDLVAGA